MFTRQDENSYQASGKKAIIYCNSLMLEKASDIYIFTRGNELVGAVACYGNEIDDLFVSESNLRHGYGRKLLIWALNQIASRGYKKCVVHVAEWNQGAVRMYLNEGFEIVKKEIISI